jgi:cytochrome P450
LQDPFRPETDAFVRDPYPALTKLREEAPVWWSEDGQYWLVTGYEQGQAILRDRRFVKGMRLWQAIGGSEKLTEQQKTFVKARSRWLVHLDPPDHTRIRAEVKAIVDGLWHAVEPTRQAEIIEDLASPFVMRTLAELLGVPQDDRHDFMGWARTLNQHVGKGLDLSMDHSDMKSLHDYLRNFVEECRISPKPGVISLLARPAADADNFTTEEILNNCILLLVAGYETTVNAIGNGVVSMLRNQDQWALLKSTPTLIKAAIDEMLRFESPVQTISEIAGDSISIGDATIARLQNVIVMIGACNRDPLQFEYPDKFDITRSGNKHLAFGEGIHHCLGSALAELLIGTFILKLIERAPLMKFAEAGAEFKRPFGLRGPRAVNIRW